MSRRESARLRAELNACHHETERLERPGFPLPALTALQRFQRARLASTYADLAAQPRYAEAVEFFLAELYGGRNVRERDRQVEQVLPIMSRMLPLRLQRVLADAFQLQAMSLRLDVALAEALHASDALPVTTAVYVAHYAVVPRAERALQIERIHALALALDEVVHAPMVLGLLSAMRAPARAAGFGALQQFLEQGLRAFRAMRGASIFADTVQRRESQVMEQLYAGAADPFAISEAALGGSRGPA